MRHFSKLMFRKFAVGLSVLFIGIQSTFAQITETQVQQFAQAISQAANQKSVDKLAQLVDDNALISLSRKGKTTTLNKNNYLELLQNNWSKTNNYHYAININNVVISGDQAKADVKTVEALMENGKPIRLITNSRVTFSASHSGAILVRAVSQLTIE